MLYLEDYVELIEHLPTDLRERFGDMREMDLQVQNRTEALNEKVKNLFQKCAFKKAKISGADQMFDEIRNEYYKVLDDADEKVQLANQIYDLVDRHLRKLDQELSKFKMELEADNAGITEVLEQRSLELDNPVSLQKGSGRERRKTVAVPQSSSSSSSLVSMTTNNGDGPLPEKRIKLEPKSESEVLNYLQQATDNNNFLNYTEKSFQPLIVESDTTVSQQSALSDPLDFTEDEPPSIATKQLQERDSFENERLLSSTAQPLDMRGTFSVKGNYELSRTNEITSKTNEFERINVDSLDTSGELVSDSSMSSMPGLIIHRPSRTKKQTSKAAAWEQERMQAEARHEQRRKENHPSTSSVGENAEHSGVEVVGDNPSGVEWNYDPNEPRYCLCNQVSYGEMVGCDNDKCPIEWFHYGCVELTEAPKGKWYCPQCTQTMKRRNKR